MTSFAPCHQNTSTYALIAVISKPQRKILLTISVMSGSNQCRQSTRVTHAKITAQNASGAHLQPSPLFRNALLFQFGMASVESLRSEDDAPPPPSSNAGRLTTHFHVRLAHSGRAWALLDAIVRGKNGVERPRHDFVPLSSMLIAVSRKDGAGENLNIWSDTTHI